MRYRSDSMPYCEGTKVRNMVESMFGTDAKGQSNIHDMRSGVFLTVVLLFLLGWVPMIGHAVAGYVGGRRSGSPIRGFISGSIGVIIAASTMAFVTTMLPSFSQLFSGLKEWIITIITENSIFRQMFDTVLVYGKNFFASIDLTINCAACITVASFGIVGGVIADQTQKEARIIAINTSKAMIRTARSIDLHKNNKELGFEFYEHCTPVSVNNLAVSVKSDISQSLSETKKTKS